MSVEVQLKADRADEKSGSLTANAGGTSGARIDASPAAASKRRRGVSRF